jgi:hypothetical protein
LKRPPVDSEAFEELLQRRNYVGATLEEPQRFDPPPTIGATFVQYI